MENNNAKPAPPIEQSAEANLLAIIENADGIIYSIDTDFRYIALNGRLKRMVKEAFGVDVKPGDHVYQFLEKTAPDDALEWKAIYTRALNGTPVTFVKEFTYSGKSEFWSFSIKPLWQNEQITGLTCFSREVSELYLSRAALQASEEKYRLIFYNNPLPCWVYDAETLTFTDVNEATLRNYGYSRQEFLAMKIFDIWLPGHKEEFINNIESKRHITSFYIWQWKHKKNSGEMIDVEVVSSPIMWKGKRLILVSAEDITAKKNAQAEIMNLNATLEKKVTERTAELEEANKELEAFSYTVAHDLVAPLRIIRGYIAIVVKGTQHTLSKSTQALLKLIEYNALQMSQLVQDLLDFSRFGKIKIKPVTFNMHKLVEDVIMAIELSETDFHSDIKLHSLTDCKGDPGLIKQVWVNLISNAVKYSSKVKQPYIQIGCEQKDNETIYYIKDNGAGFDMKMAHKLFQVFHRLHGKSEFEGSGVGLALVHRIITRHGGKIWVDAKVGEGATFYFTLPA